MFNVHQAQLPSLERLYRAANAPDQNLGDAAPLDHERLEEAYERHAQVSVHLCGSGEAKTLYLYRHRQ